MTSVVGYDLSFIAERLNRFAISAGLAGAPERYVVFGGTLLPHRDVISNGKLTMRILSTGN